MRNSTRHLSVKEVADMVKVSTDHVYKALNRRELKAGRTSQGQRARWRIHPDEVTAWLERNTRW